MSDFLRDFFGDTIVQSNTDRITSGDLQGTIEVAARSFVKVLLRPIPVVSILQLRRDADIDGCGIVVRDLVKTGPW